MFGQENSKIKQRFLQLFFDNPKKKKYFYTIRKFKQCFSI